MWDKLGAIIGAVITAIGGFYMYDRKTTNDRLTKVESDLVQNKLEIKIIEVKLEEVKEDTSEIKEYQKTIIELLTKRRK